MLIYVTMISFAKSLNNHASESSEEGLSKAHNDQGDVFKYCWFVGSWNSECCVLCLKVVDFKVKSTD